MKNCLKRDLTSELALINRMTGNVVCTIDSDQWCFNRDTSEDAIIATSTAQELITRFFKERAISLDGEKMTIYERDGRTDFVVKKSLITTIRPDPFHPQTNAKIFEFGVCNLSQVNDPLLAIINVDDKQMPSFFYYFSHWTKAEDRLVCSVDSPKVSCCLNGVRFNFRSRSFVVYEFHEDTKSKPQLVVEADGSFTYDEFCECVRRILTVIGFFTGVYCFGPFWVFNSQSHNFIAYNYCMPKGGSTKYHMWSLNPYEYLADADKSPEAAKKVEKELKPITKGQFEKLLMLLDEERYSHFFYIFQDINLNMTHLMASSKFPAYAACLEACKEWWIHKSPRRASMLFTKQERNDLIKRFDELLKKRYPGNPDAEYILEKKIRNHSIFRSGNMDELKEAISSVGVDLSEEEIGALSWRNDILHGRDIIKSAFSGDCPALYVNESERKLFLLHEIIWRFIMKTIGYEGLYIDVAKVNELFRDSKTNNGEPLKKRV